ncbi:hypothetical protein FHS29_004899 [Saccharothrix tamanrassetensis]|uniref:Uncharacterized protein n=1 Tax=Saccharothrix tamanrassetensis TaxID=1051531 RepID=A0A841CL75_9PSEU|nr:hypothetical protein [Saccharothrix tamanrassetensis]MBB5958291.1 hypothetical protein [Saccharothrix tamanrassetensis]
MNFNDEVDWPDVFREHISRPSLADPRNPRRSTYVTTMLFLEGALREIDDQLSGRSRLSRDELAGARLTRRIVVERAVRVAGELSADDQEGLRVGDGGFKDRWPGLGGTANFFMCLIKYTCTAPRWGVFLDYGPRKALAELSKVRSGELELADLIGKISAHDLRMRTRLAKYWLFQLSLTMDAKWRAVATKAYRELLDAYSDRWIPVYEEGLRQLGVKFRPGMTPKKLSAMISALTSGFAQHIAGTGDESPVDGENGCVLLAEAVQGQIYAALDHGDDCDISAALRNTLLRRP